MKKTWANSKKSTIIHALSIVVFNPYHRDKSAADDFKNIVA